MIYLFTLFTIACVLFYIGRQSERTVSFPSPRGRLLCRRVGGTILMGTSIIWILLKGFERGIIDVLTILPVCGIAVVTALSFYFSFFSNVKHNKQ